MSLGEALRELELYDGIKRCASELLLLLTACPKALGTLICNSSRFVKKELALGVWVKGIELFGGSEVAGCSSEESTPTDRNRIRPNFIRPKKKNKLKKGFRPNNLKCSFFETIRLAGKTKYKTDSIIGFNLVGLKATQNFSILSPKTLEQLQSFRFSEEAFDALICTARQQQKDKTGWAVGVQKERPEDYDLVVRLEASAKKLRDLKGQIIKSHLKLVVSIAKRYCYDGQLVGDLIQEGNVGLICAIDKFERQRGVKFSTYAAWWVRQSVTKFLTTRKRKGRPPVRILECTGPNHFEITPPSIFSWKAGMRASQTREGQLGGALSYLSDREATVIRLRFGLADSTRSHTLEEIGRHLGVTRERVRQIEAQALRKLRCLPFLRRPVA
ncbi:RNA polymerase, sigma 70 (sigma D) factor [Candidatus Tremblaya phenacola PAVE]|nr:RNA polymerase, sigma 70 (sigma D) factor [Candidatus Tremblaya phenacola PAVE]